MYSSKGSGSEFGWYVLIVTLVVLPLSVLEGNSLQRDTDIGIGGEGGDDSESYGTGPRFRFKK